MAVALSKHAGVVITRPRPGYRRTAEGEIHCPQRLEKKLSLRKAGQRCGEETEKKKRLVLFGECNHFNIAISDSLCKLYK